MRQWQMEPWIGKAARGGRGRTGRVREKCQTGTSSLLLVRSHSPLLLPLRDGRKQVPNGLLLLPTQIARELNMEQDVEIALLAREFMLGHAFAFESLDEFRRGDSFQHD